MRSKVLSNSSTRKNNGVFGKQVIGEFYGIHPDHLMSIDHIKNIVSTSILRAKSILHGLQVPYTSSNGVMMVAFLSEAHISILTFPEHRTMFLDVFSGSENCNPMLIVDTVATLLKPDRVKVREILRGDDVENE